LVPRRQGVAAEVRIMVDDGTGAASRGGSGGGRKGARANRGVGKGGRSAKGDGDPERMRVSYRIAVETWQRLGVHCRLARVDEHAFVERAILASLRERGKGQDVFDRDRPDDREDRQSESAA
jgi:hypothetical protein